MKKNSKKLPLSEITRLELGGLGKKSGFPFHFAFYIELYMKRNGTCIFSTFVRL